MDIAKGMIYIHSLSIIHGFLNSFSVFIDEKLRAKIGNLEFSQKVGDMKHEIACCGIQKNWMAPEQISHEPPDTLTASDVYRLVQFAFRFTFLSSDMQRKGGFSLISFYLVQLNILKFIEIITNCTHKRTSIE